MRFLVTMHMPSSNGFLVHQVIFDHEADSLAQFTEALNGDLFVIGRQYYKRHNDGGDNVFLDKGEMILNTNHIGKVQVYYDFEQDAESRPAPKQRPPMRGRTQQFY